MKPTRSRARLLAILASGALTVTMSAGTAFAAPCHGCDDPDLPGDPGGDPDCGIVATTEPAISTPTPRVGFTTGGTRGVWGGNPTTYKYQWMADGAPIAGATSLISPALPESAYDKPLVLRVIASRGDCKVGVDYSQPKTVAEGTPPIMQTSPTLSSHSPRVGESLSVTSGTWSPAATSHTYQWRSNGSLILGANSATYTPFGALAGRTLSVVVTAKRTGYAQASMTLTAGAIAAGAAPVATTVPSLSAKPRVGSELSVNVGTWLPEVTSHRYQWRANGVPVLDANGSRFIPTPDLAGKSLDVVVSGVKGGYETGHATSIGTTVLPATPLAWTTTPRVAGKAVFGKVLKVKTGKISGKPAAVTFQWRRDGVAIPQASSRTYEVSRADIGHRLSVRVIATKMGTPRLVKTLQAGTPTVAFMRWTGEALSIDGGAQVGSTLTSSLSPGELLAGTNPDARKVAYRWLRDGRAIAGATDASYTATAADRGKTLTLRVALTKPGHKTVVRKATQRIR